MNLLASLRYLVALDEHKHFGRAALACHVTQPALSNALRALEEEMGATIINRGRVFVGLTPEGERVLESAQRMLRERASEILMALGLGHALNRRANLLEHAEQRFLEIARALAMRPRFVLLDEPAGGLTGAEIERLGVVIRTMRDCGIGVLLVEHHTEFVFGISDRVTTLNLGRILRHGTPQEVRNDPEVIRVYLGA